MLTGKPGDMMKESVQYALKVAWGLLGKKEQAKILKLHASKKSFGIHAHCPDAATPKDGPSAGGAFTTAFISRILGRKIRNDIAMTGEIDLMGNIMKIGGLNYKLIGAKKAGVKIVLVPEENKKDLDTIYEKYPNLINDNFQVRIVSNIDSIIDMILET